MSYWKILDEAPELLPAQSFGLDDPVKNAEMANDIMRKKSLVVLWDTPTHIMGRTGDNNNSGFFALYNKNDKLLDYVVKYENQKIKLVGHFVTQVAVWRNDLVAATANLSSRIFFEYILPMKNIVVSDREQTPAGKRFWILRMNDAVGRGLSVGLIDIRNKKIDWCGEDFQTWMDTHMYAWKDSADGQNYRFMISREKF